MAQEPFLLLYTSMNEQYNETITRNGRVYHYDPDHDVYYSRDTPESTISRYSWIVLSLVLAAVCYWAEFIR